MGSFLEHQITTMTRRLAWETAAIKISLALRALGRKNWEDEPRIPGGQHGGGRWTVGGGGDAVGRRQRVAEGLGRVVFHGILVRQNYNSKMDATECWFYDKGEDYRFMKTWSGKTDCPSGYIY